MAKFLVVCGGAGRTLLLSREAYGFDAALQIDVVENLASNDGRIIFVELPNPRDRGVSGSQAVARYSESVDYPHSRAHAQRVIASQAVEGKLLGQIPAVPLLGRALATAEHTKQDINQALIRLTRFADPADTVHQFWVVASTSDGIGQGVYQSVIEQIARMSSATNMVSTVHVLRIEYGLTDENDLAQGQKTCWAVASDYAFAWVKPRIEQDVFGLLSLNYFYIHLPVPEYTHSAQEGRTQLTDVAMRALCTREVDNISAILTTGVGVAGKIILPKIGTWVADFSVEELMRSALRDVLRQIREIIEPSDTTLLRDVVDVSVRASTEEFPTHITNYPATSSQQEKLPFADIFALLRQNTGPQPMKRTTIDEFNQSAEWKQYQQCIKLLVGESHTVDEELQHLTTLELEENQGVPHRIAFASVNEPRRYTAEYIYQLRTAKKYVLWLESQFSKTEGPLALASLRNAWQRMQNRAKSLLHEMMKSDSTRKQDVIEHYAAFVEHYACMQKMMTQYREALRVLGSARSLIVIDDHAASLPDTRLRMEEEKFVIADLSDVIEGKTYLAHLVEALQSPAGPARMGGAFERAVLSGVRGLTEIGLKQVLKLPMYATIAQIVETLNTGVVDAATEWFGMTPPNASDSVGWFQHNSRLFPQLPQQLFENMIQESRVWELRTNRRAPIYIQTDAARTGLSVYTVEAYVPHPNAPERQFSFLIQSSVTAMDLEQSNHPGQADLVTAHCLASNGTPVYLPTRIEPSDTVLVTYVKFMRETMHGLVTTVDVPSH